jgi:hypothetical protein
MSTMSTSFCTSCGSRRTGASRFCTQCGAEFRDRAGNQERGDERGSATQLSGQPALGVQPPVEQPPVEPAPLEPAPVEQPASWTRPPAEQPASWTQPANQVQQPPDQHEPWDREPVAEPVRGVPASAESIPYEPLLPGAAPSYETGPSYESGPPSGRGRRKGLIIAAVVVAVLAIGGGAYAAISVSSHHSSAGPAARRPTGSASGLVATETPAASQTPTATPSATPTASPSQSTTPSPSPSVSSGTVRVAAAAAASPEAPHVTALLNRYFNAINTKNYGEYSSLLDAQMRANNPAATFASGYATSKDTAETLTSISGSSGGNLAATVSFTSRQSPADSIDHSSCNDWQLTLYLVPKGSGYVIGSPPSGYQPVYSDC